MKKIIGCLIVLIFLAGLPQIGFGDETVAVSREEIKFDYSKYLAPKAWQAIEESQGILYIGIPTFGQPKVLFAHALVIDEKEGLILSVAHSLSEFPTVAFSETTDYAFIFQGKEFAASLKYVDKEADLAIFQLKKNGEDFSKLKRVKFTKNVLPFGEYYGFNQDLDYSPQFGFYPVGTYPFKAKLIDKYDVVKMKLVNQFIAVPAIFVYLSFDKPIKPGFSGAGVFNNEGEVVGIFQITWLGYSRAISAETILDFIERASEKEKEKK